MARPARATARGPHGAWVLLPGALLIGGIAAVTTMAAFMIMMILTMALPMVLIATIAMLVHHSRGRRGPVRRWPAPVAPPPTSSWPPLPPRSEVTWSQARERFDRLRREYAGFECDPMSVLRLPALADVSVPSTGRFVDAFAEAQALETEVWPRPPYDASFVAAVDRAERAWRAAREAAERIRLSGLSPAERGAVERVIKLLTTARDSDSDAERLAAYSFARSELAKLDRLGAVHLPRAAQAALDAAARGELPG
jgi:hypothetical protein